MSVHSVLGTKIGCRPGGGLPGGSYIGGRVCRCIGAEQDTSVDQEVFQYLFVIYFCPSISNLEKVTMLRACDISGY